MERITCSPPAEIGICSHAVELLPAAFTASQPWNPQRIRALAMYCSDGRWGDAFDEFCHDRLWIPRYDRFAVPGGPAWLTEDHAASGSILSQAAWEQLGLLVRVHELQRIVLMAHYGCAFYRERLGRDAEGCVPVQVEDLERAGDAVKTRFPQICVETFMAMREDERLAFHRIV
jgi:hypothetical protein